MGVRAHPLCGSVAMGIEDRDCLVFDERLGLSEDVKSDLAGMVFGPVPHVLVTSSYHVPLTIDSTDDGEVFVRAATGAEVVDALAADDTEAEKNFWPSDPPTLLESVVRWQHHPGEPPIEEQAVLVWEAEVLFKDGHGQGGAFFAQETAAAAEAFSSALAQPAGDVFGCQIVPYACARRLAPSLLRGGDNEARRLTRYAISPLQPHGPPRTIPLAPGPNIKALRDVGLACGSL